ncbi:MAG: pullulanase-type alpha-1,6-glucosidase [Micropruina sp.]|uniref:pullulanase-type alpha-1,6-glucosidase n=1 Tax=Micropruina sp. TaxID=2737536 RepID=UPI0039E6D22B
MRSTPLRRTPARRTLSVAAVAALLISALPATALADHTPLPSSVVLVGSLQSELGCASDWQPDCTATRLTAVPGEQGRYRGTFTVPAGSYDYKVALNGSWTENYGAAGAPGGANLSISTKQATEVTFSYDHASHVIGDDLPKSVTGKRAAQWLEPGLIAVQLPAERTGFSYRLFAAPEGGLRNDAGSIVGGSSSPLSLRGALPKRLKKSYPQLASYQALQVPKATQRRLAELLTGQLAVAVYDAQGALVSSTGVQLPGVLDEIYHKATTRTFGPVWSKGRPSLSVWAPTAKSVSLLLDPAGSAPERTVPMKRAADGSWTVRGDRSWRNARYLYQVRVYVPSTDAVEVNKVTDPYSVALTTNSTHSVLADLADPALRPSGWTRLVKPKLASPEASTIYELHVRDFSINDATVPAAHRGTFLAFSDSASDGMRQLRTLARAGLNTVHLLPVNDISSIEEDRAKQQSPDCDLAAMAPDSDQQQECVEAVAAKDGFNWGYDPLHYTNPEGSYATDPDGPGRTREFREMVKGLNSAGLRTVIDVVYNHTPAAGQDPKSILDRVVPGYYQRLTATGQVETSTCCSNTATEHAMMGKLMIDSVLTWATQYKVDGFRFDLMGHQPKAAMVELRKKLNKLTLNRDGVDGKRIYLYGEGWNFGEVADNARFVQATQKELAGTGIGAFNDRLRDAVRGGGPFDEDQRIQGFASGQFTDPNGVAANGTPEQQKASLLHNQDLIKVGLTGSLRDYRLVNAAGKRVKGSQIDYNGAPAGYTADPQEAVTYVEAHDNETLYDALVYKLPTDTAMADRIRMQTLALSTTALGQGVSFWHAGAELLRSKSLDRNSYDSGDWFNVYDVTKRTNGFGRGLPPKADNESKWPLMRTLLGDAALRPQRSEIAAAERQALDLLRIRKSSPLFRLGSAALIKQKLRFASGGPAQTPGVIVMRIDDTVGPNVDRKLRGLVVVFNATPGATTQTVPGVRGHRFRLHDVQADGSDPVVKTSSFDATAGSFTVPGRTVAVFVER